MRSHLLRRFFQSAFLIWGVLTLTFFLMHAAPGDPMDRYISPRIPPETIRQIRQQFGFDQSLSLQYLKWLQQWLRGDWGYSLTQHRPVAKVLSEAIPTTLQLTISVVALSFMVGIVLGAVAAFYRHRWPGPLLSNGLLAAYCLPSFWLGLMLILIFSVKLGWLPNSHAASLFAEEMDAWASLQDRLLHLILPTLTLALPGAAVAARCVRENLLIVLESNFILLAKAKGLSTWQIITCHALPHALISLISLLGLSLPFLFGGAFLTEIIFAWPGMGRVTVEAIFSRDYPVVLAASGISAILVIAGNFIADILYRFADPRIRMNK
jgi:peptide/nickel transport system permease protein